MKRVQGWWWEDARYYSPFDWFMFAVLWLSGLGLVCSVAWAVLSGGCS